MIPGDLVTDLDLLALDSSVLTQFGATSSKLNEKRQIAVADWLRRHLEQANLRPDRHRTKRAPDTASHLQGGIYTDITASLVDISTDKFLNSLLVSPSADALFVGMYQPFRGLVATLSDTINAASAVASITYWNGQWSAPSSLVDGTIVSSKSFARGGRITWAAPDDWIPRAVGNTVAYFVRLQVNSALTAPTLFQQLLPLCRSRLTEPVACYTLHLVYREGIANTRGDWKVKADTFLQAANLGLESALLLCRDEFDVDNDQAVERLEVNSMTSDPFTWERG